LLNLLLLSSTSEEALILAGKFLETRDIDSILQAPLHFTSPSWVFGEVGNMKAFKGTIIEIFAQFGFRALKQIKLLLEYGRGSFDPSKVLFMYAGSHDHRACKDYCLMKEFLDYGADPNIADYQFTLLQMAVVSWDFNGVIILLKSNADPNATGNTDGIVWQEGTSMSRFNYLREHSPLYICRHFDHVSTRFDDRFTKPRKVEPIEAALLEYGAIEISPPSELLKRSYLPKSEHASGSTQSLEVSY
jgi:hypothetical protein